MQASARPGRGGLLVFLGEQGSALLGQKQRAEAGANPLRSCFFTASSPVGDADAIAGHPRMPITWQVRMSEPGS